LYVSWGPPHRPGRAPEGYARIYDPQQFRLRPNVPARYEIEAGRRHAGYYGLCSALDANIGRLLDTLEKNGLAGDTIVVFTADHGDMLGSQGLEDDNHPYEESARVPLLIRYPRRLAAGERSDLLISNVDLMPTLLSLCGVQIPEAVQGRDLSGLMTRQADSRPESVFVEGRLGTAEEWRMLVRGLDKLVVNAQLEITHLYNLGQDPYEMKNFADDKTQERKKDEMKAILRDWIFRTSDRVPYPARKHPK
jgi:arylsulfatase A-like enzyme